MAVLQGKKFKTMNSRKKRVQAKRRLIKIFCLFGMLITFFLAMLIYVNLNDGDTKIAKGVKICGFDVSNNTKKQALKRYKKYMNDLYQTKFTFDTDGKKTDIALNELGIYTKEKNKELVNKAYSYGKDGLLISRFFRIIKLKKSGIDIKPQFALKKSSANIVLKKNLPTFDGAAQNATLKVVKSKIKIVKEKKGLILDNELTIRGVLEVLNNNWDRQGHIIKVSSKTGYPEIRAKDLKEVKDVLGTYTTYYIAGAESAVNIEAGARHVIGTVVMPGEEISVNTLMEPYTEAEGYGMANSYADGEIVQSMGGGICQVSTTLYNALIISELQITRRNAHSMPINYVSLGRDAAVSDDSEGNNVKDLRFKNNTEYPIFIDGFAADGTITFTIYGKETRDPNRDFSFECTVDGKSEEEYKKQEQEEQQARQKDPNAPKPKKKTITVVLHKVVYVNGQEVSRDFFSESKYLIKPAEEEQEE